MEKEKLIKIMVSIDKILKLQDETNNAINRIITRIESLEKVIYYGGSGQV